MSDDERLYYSDYLNTYGAYCKNKMDLYMNMKKDLFSDYYKYIEKCASLVKELGLPYNSISISYVIAFLLKNGNFSINDKFKFDYIKEDPWEKTGLYVISGIGCCRHIADFANDIYNELEINSLPYPCTVSNELSNNLLDDNGNHLANLIYYEGIPYVYDLDTYNVIKFINDKVAFNNTNEYKYYSFKPLYLGLFYGVDAFVIDKLISDFNNASCIDCISDKQIYEIELETLNKILKNNDLIYDFSYETKVLKKEISSKMVLKNNRIGVVL